MRDSLIEAIRRRKYVVRTFLPQTGRSNTSAFATDVEAVWFMERAVHQGATIIECRAPDAADDVMDLAMRIAAPC